MSAIVLDGKALAKKSENDLAERVTRIKDLNDGRAPILATILVGDDPASATYVDETKCLQANRNGINSN